MPTVSPLIPNVIKADMNNKEFLEKVSQKTNFELSDVKNLSADLVTAILDEIAQGNTITIQGVGTFEPREKARRKIYNPTTKSFIVVPKKTTLSFKMSGTLKERLNME